MFEIKVARLERQFASANCVGRYSEAWQADYATSDRCAPRRLRFRFTHNRAGNSPDALQQAVQIALLGTLPARGLPGGEG